MVLILIILIKPIEIVTFCFALLMYDRPVQTIIVKS
jgi:hypothetical protein